MVKRPKRRGAGSLKVGIVTIVVAISIFFYPTLILMAVAMLPTAVSVVVDRSPARMGWVCVGGMNFAGTLPYLVKLWANGGTLVASLDIVADVFSVLVIYLAAALGWLLYISVPQIVALATAMTSTSVIATLTARQKKLVEQWGPEVKGVAEKEAKDAKKEAKKDKNKT